MAVGHRLCWCLLFAFAIISSARNSISLSGNEIVVEERSLKAMTDDYGDPSANPGHDPRNKGGGGGHSNGRKSRDNP